MKKIDSLSDLKAERFRLSQKKLFLENEIKNDFKLLKENFAPIQLFTDSAAKMLVNNNIGILNGFTALILDLVLKKVMLKNSGIITRLILPFLAKITANNLISENKTKILGWLGDLILKVGKRDNEPVSNKTASDIGSEF